MRATQVRIHNFRSICDATISLRPYSLLVGVNNAGKSTVIDAIRCFYGDLKFDATRDFPRKVTEDKESWVEIEFAPSQDELPDLKDEYKSSDGTFLVRNYFQSSSKTSDGKAKSGPYAYINGELSDNRFYGFKNVGQAKFGELIYIPAVSKIDEHTKLTGPSALRHLVNSVLTRVMENSAAYRSLNESFKSFEGSIKTETTEDGYSLKTIEDDVTAELTQWGVAFQLNVKPVGIDELVKNLIEHDIEDPSLGTTQPSSAYGQGFQRSLIYSLIRVASQYTTKKVQPKKNDFTPQLTWILFEEPEAFLHPTQTSLLSRSLQQLPQDESTQVLLSTHSPQFASHSVQDVPAICRLHRTECNSIAYQISGKQLEEILKSNNDDAKRWKAEGLRVSDDDLTIDMESIKYSLWLDSRRCGAFFADRVLLVEGPTETALLSYLYDQGDLPCCHGVFVLDTIGKYNFPRFMRLLKALGIRHYVLYDGDRGKHSSVDSSIQDAANEFTGGIETFEKDLEAFLGIPPAQETRRKPQHLMYHLVNGNITDEKIRSLVTKIEHLLSN